MKKSVQCFWAMFLSILVILSITACGSSNTERNRKAIIIGESGTFSTFDPLGAIEGQGFLHYYKMVYETLVDYEDGKPVPVLAESWEKDGGTWTFHLRKNVKFTDSEPFNAEAVKTNFEGLQTHMMDSISYYGAISRMTEIEVVDEYTVRFHYSQPYYAVLEELSAAVFGILSPKLFENGATPYGTVTATAGTGPYKIEAGNYTERVSYQFSRNAEYWGESHGPDNFTVKLIEDEDARMLALQNKEIDLLYGSAQLTYDMYETLTAQEGIETTQSQAVYATRNLLLNTSGNLLEDARVRKAIQHGTHKEQIVSTVLHGMERQADTLFPKTLPFCDVEQTVYPYDPELAVKLLEEAGWNEIGEDGIRVKDGKRLTLEAICMSEHALDQQILMAFKGQMAQIGIEVNVLAYETNTWFELGYSGEFDISVNDTYGFPQDPQVFIAAMLDYALDYTAQQGLDKKAEIDEKIGAMLTTADESVIQDAYTYILTTLQEAAINVPVSGMREIAAFNSDKIESIVFANDPSTCYINKIVLK